MNETSKITRRIIAVTIWNQDVEGNRVGEAVRLDIPPEHNGFSTPHAMHHDAVRYGYRTRYRYECAERTGRG